MRTLNRYLLREIAIPFGLGLGIVTLILLIARILKLVELVVNRGVPLLQVLKLFSYILPAFLELTVPMALLLAVLVAFGTAVVGERAHRHERVRRESVPTARAGGGV